MLILYLFLSFISITQAAERPNIIFIIADDLGWNDVGFHGSNQIPTPNIDALAFSGIILNNYYVNHLGTPSRSALMTGKYPIHTGMQRGDLLAGEPRGVPLNEKFLPEYLKELGYSNHMVGKWHLGHYKKEYTPLYRGFDSHFGFWSRSIDYYDHTCEESDMWGLDFRKGLEPAWDHHGEYSTDLFTEKSVQIIKNQNVSEPLFLYIAHSAVHSGSAYDPLPAPEYLVEKFSYIKNYNRSRFAAVLTKLDESVGNVIHALSSKNMLNNSIIVFTTDNGGPAEGRDSNAASNWPLRGMKNTLWEGGIRGAAFVWSPLLEKSKRVARQMMHIADWLPTLYTAAGGNSETIVKNLDAIDLWEALSKDLPSKRTEILHSIDGQASLMESEWKVIIGSQDKNLDGWFGPSGEGGFYNLTEIIISKSGRAVKSLPNGNLIPEEMFKMRDESHLSCGDSVHSTKCNPSAHPCLFNIVEDPCEKNNLASSKRSILAKLLEKVEKYNSTAVPPSNVDVDPRSNPIYWNNTWTNFGDGEEMEYYVPFVTRI